MEENTKQKSWWGRNWIWVLPTGGCLLSIIMIVVFAGSLFYGITAIMSDSQAHIDALEKTKANKEVVLLLGEPIETNGISAGSVNYNNGIKTAELSIPIKGPKGEATIQVSGEGVENNWNYDVMRIYINDTDTVIDLLEEDILIEEFKD